MNGGKGSAIFRAVDCTFAGEGFGSERDYAGIRATGRYGGEPNALGELSAASDAAIWPYGRRRLVEHPVAREAAGEEGKSGELASGVARLGPPSPQGLRDGVGDDRGRRSRRAATVHPHRHPVGDSGVGRGGRAFRNRSEGDTAKLCANETGLDDDDVDAEALQLPPQAVGPALRGRAWWRDTRTRAGGTSCRRRRRRSRSFPRSPLAHVR